MLSLAAVGGVFAQEPANVAPTLALLTPPAAGEVADTAYAIHYEAADPDDQAGIILYFDRDADMDGGTLIVSGLVEQDGPGVYAWDTSWVPPGYYHIYGVIGDPWHAAVKALAPGLLRVRRGPVLEGVDFQWEAPNGAGDEADQSYELRWTDNEGEHPAFIRLYVDDDGSGLDGAPLALDIPVADGANRFVWDCSQTPSGFYYFYAIVDDGYTAPVAKYSPGPVYVLHPGDNHVPELALLTPPAGGGVADQSYTIQWRDSDPDDDAQIEIYVDASPAGAGGRLLVGGISEDDPVNAYPWDTSAEPNGWTYLYGVINDGSNPPVKAAAPGPLYIKHDLVNVPPEIEILDPGAAGATADQEFLVRYRAVDPDDNARLDFFYDRDAAGWDGVLLAENRRVQDTPQEFSWETAGLPPGDYWIYALADDVLNQQVSSYSKGPVAISHPERPNSPPGIVILKPDGHDPPADRSYAIRWADMDLDSDAEIALYYDTGRDKAGGILIAAGISEDDSSDAYDWNTAQVPEGEYYVYAVIDDRTNPPVSEVSRGALAIEHPATPEPVNAAPRFTWLEPETDEIVISGHGFRLRYAAYDPDDQAVIDLLAAQEFSSAAPLPIARGLMESDGAADYQWDTGGWPLASYWLVAKVTGGAGQAIEVASGARVTIIAESAPADGGGALAAGAEESCGCALPVPAPLVCGLLPLAFLLGWRRFWRSGKRWNSHLSCPRGN